MGREFTTEQRRQMQSFATEHEAPPLETLYGMLEADGVTHEEAREWVWHFQAEARHGRSNGKLTIGDKSYGIEVTNKGLVLGRRV